MARSDRPTICPISLAENSSRQCNVNTSNSISESAAATSATCRCAWTRPSIRSATSSSEGLSLASSNGSCAEAGADFSRPCFRRSATIFRRAIPYSHVVKLALRGLKRRMFRTPSASA